MKFERDLIFSPTGVALLVIVIVVLGILVLRWHKDRRAALPPSSTPTAQALPRTFQRIGARFPILRSKEPDTSRLSDERTGKSKPSAITPSLAISLLSSAQPFLPASATPAPYGRLIPCQTVTAIESNRVDTPVIGLVTEDLWHDGQLIVPAGAEVHGKATLDRTHERLAVQGAWRIVWRTPDARNGTELKVEGLALDRELADGQWGASDGSAGLRGQIVKTQDHRELQLFASAFLASATSALQDTRGSFSALGEMAVPAATVRNAALSGTSALLREYAQTMREAIARDGFYLRIPAGKTFYLYVTQSLTAPPRATQP